MQIDWSGCDLVEVIPGKVSGTPLVVGTRIPADFVIESFEAGETIDAIREGYPSLSEETVSGLIRFAEERRRVSVA